MQRHFMMNERSEVLVGVSPFFIMKAPVIMTRHDRHILQVATTAFITHGAVMRVVGHQPFYYLAAKSFGCFI
jgi:hypothetical protein